MKVLHDLEEMGQACSCITCTGWGKLLRESDPITCINTRQDMSISMIGDAHHIGVRSYDILYSNMYDCLCLVLAEYWSKNFDTVPQ